MVGIVNQAQTGKRVVTPEAQRVVIAAKKIMAQPEVAQHLLLMMKSAQDPATGIAQATIYLMKQLYEKSNGTMPPQAIVPAAQEVLVDVMRIGQAAGLFKITAELAGQAVQVALRLFKESVPQDAQQTGAPEPAAMPAQAGPMMPQGQPTMEA